MEISYWAYVCHYVIKRKRNKCSYVCSLCDYPMGWMRIMVDLHWNLFLMLFLFCLDFFLSKWVMRRIFGYGEDMWMVILPLTCCFHIYIVWFDLRISPLRLWYSSSDFISWNLNFLRTLDDHKMDEMVSLLAIFLKV